MGRKERGYATSIYLYPRHAHAARMLDNEGNVSAGVQTAIEIVDYVREHHSQVFAEALLACVGQAENESVELQEPAKNTEQPNE